MLVLHAGCLLTCRVLHTGCYSEETESVLESMVKKHVETHAMKHDKMHAEKRAEKLAKKRARKRVKKAWCIGACRVLLPYLLSYWIRPRLKSVSF